MVTVHLSALATTLDLELGLIPGFDFDVGSVKDVAVDIYLAFERSASRDGGSGHVLVLSPAVLTGAAGLAEDLGVIPEAGPLIEQLLTPELESRISAIHRFFAEVLARMSPFLGDPPAIFIDARTVTETSLLEEKGTSILVRWTSDPAARRTTTPPQSIVTAELLRVPTADTGPVRAPVGATVPVHANPGRHGGVGGPLGGGTGSTADPGSDNPVDRGPRGAMPSGFLVGDPQSVARLDRIDTIVVLMMENRSFDHLLGSLRQLNTKYDGLTGSEKNTVVERGQTRTVRMVRAENAVAPPITQISVSPNHSFDHVKAQIADGAMSGFAADLLPIGDPQLALTFYTENDIPNHYQLAQSHMVCDQWFAAHPGPTYPNRWATLQGAIPGLNNLDIDDPQLGFMRDPTIFDLLTEEGISWNYFENNVSMLRMYGRYRLDNVNVLPYDDPEEGFEHKAAAGTLPSVVFVDPRFTGIPPLRQASDDHPPADLRVGQQLIARVYNALVNSPHWERLLFVITYDEHGGFFDHAPPPGTTLGPTEFDGKIPRLHPDGADSMGARVPTIIISPFVNQGDVSHVVFDHTSILKTILVRHRNRFFSDQFRRFSNHVFKINHLGAALNRDTPRPEPPVRLPEPPRRQRPTLQDDAVPRVRRRPTEMPPDGDRNDFGVSLARSMLPKHA
jgi:phospholipase C